MYHNTGFPYCNISQYAFWRIFAPLIAPCVNLDDKFLYLRLLFSEGYYILTSATSRTVNQKARIQSPQINPGGKSQCLTFWYHMYGANVGSLNLYVQTRPTLGSPFFTKSGSAGNSWKQASVTLPSTGTYNVSKYFACLVIFHALVVLC